MRVLAAFSSSSFLPSIPAIAKDLNTTATILDVTVAIYIVVLAICPLAWAPYAGVCRLQSALHTLPAADHDLRWSETDLPPQSAHFRLRLAGCRTLPNSDSSHHYASDTRCISTPCNLAVVADPSAQALAPPLCCPWELARSVTCTLVRTVAKLWCAIRDRNASHSRHSNSHPQGFFYSGILVGPALAPVIAGILTEYVQPRGTGWRAMQYLLFAMGLLASLLVVMFLPETAHSRGIDLIREERRSRHREMHTKDDYNSTLVNDNGASWWTRWTRDLVFVWLNPLAPLKMLWHPHILAMVRPYLL